MPGFHRRIGIEGEVSTPDASGREVPRRSIVRIAPRRAVPVGSISGVAACRRAVTASSTKAMGSPTRREAAPAKARCIRRTKRLARVVVGRGYQRESGRSSPRTRSQDVPLGRGSPTRREVKSPPGPNWTSGAVIDGARVEVMSRSSVTSPAEVPRLATRWLLREGGLRREGFGTCTFVRVMLPRTGSVRERPPGVRCDRGQAR